MLCLTLLAACHLQRGRRPSPSAAARERAAEWVHLENLGAPADDALLVELAAAQALDVARRWGTLQHVVTIRLHPTHDALEKAAKQNNVPWMRGWARYADVELETPAQWGGDREPYNVVELLAHEFTHVVMYQQVAQPHSWTAVSIPLWFREGMASVTSSQGYRRMGTRELGTWLRAHPQEDPWLGNPTLTPQVQRVVYGAGHRAFEHVLRHVQDAGVVQLLGLLRQGTAFDAAFAAVTGQDQAAFLASFRHDLERAATLEPAWAPATTETAQTAVPVQLGFAGWRPTR